MMGLFRVIWRNNADLRKRYLGPKILTKDKKYYYKRIGGIVYKKTDLKNGWYAPNLNEVMAECLMPCRK